MISDVWSTISQLRDLKLLAFFSILFIWIAIRAKATDESRARTGIGLLACSIVFQPIVGGIPGIQRITEIGGTEAIFVWLLFSLVLLEIALIKKRPPTYKPSRNIIISIIIFWLVGFTFALFQEFSFNPSFFYVPVGVTLFALLPADKNSINILFQIFQVAILIYFALAITNYKFLEETNDHIVRTFVSADNLDYENVSWEIFGVFERYRGPFQSSNNFGSHIGFMLVVLAAHRGKATWVSMVLGSLLLLFSSSRGSIIVTLAGVAVIFVAERLGRQGKKLRLFNLSFAPAVSITLFTFFVARNNLTLTGRTMRWSQYLEIWRQSPIVGSGIGLKSVENAYIYTLASMGLIGALCLAGILFQIFRILPTTFSLNQVGSLAVFVWVVVRNFTDTIFTFSGWDIGILAILSITLYYPRSEKMELVSRYHK